MVPRGWQDNWESAREPHRLPQAEPKMAAPPPPTVRRWRVAPCRYAPAFTSAVPNSREAALGTAQTNAAWLQVETVTRKGISNGNLTEF